MAHFTIMTWNVESFSAKAPNFAKKVAVIEEALHLYAPDVVALQEICDEEAFKSVAKETYPNRALSTHPDARGIRVGILSRFPLSEIGEVPSLMDNLPFDVFELNAQNKRTTPVKNMSRGVLHARIAWDGGFELHVATAHLKSKLISYPTTGGGSSFNARNSEQRILNTGLALAKRTAEAMTLRGFADGFLVGNAAKGLIILGDMNDSELAATTQLIQGPEGNEIGTGGFPIPDKGDDNRLFNLSACISEERRYSRIYEGRKELIDHIFASVEFFPDRHVLPVVDSKVDFKQVLPSIGNDPGLRASSPYPDHAPLVATFTYSS
jgi:predicted extracellular nuclease